MYFSQVINNRVNFVSVQREFRTNEGSTDYATIPEVTLAGDFVIEFDFLSAAVSVNQNIINFGDFLIRIQTDTQINVWGSVDFTPAVFVVPELGAQIHNIRIFGNTNSTSITLYLDGVLIGTADGGSAPVFSGSWLLFQWTNKHFKGILANLKIYDAGTLARNYPINDGKNILANVATALGNEIDGLTYALTTAIGGVASVVLSSLSVIGKTYLVEVSYSGVVGDASVRIGGFSGPSFTGTGTIEFVATATTAVNDILGALTGVTSGSVTVSIKEAEGYGTIINGNASDWGLFDKQANGDWLGQELSITGTFDSVDIGGDAVTRYNVASVFSGSSYMLSTGIRNHLGSGDVGFIGTSAGTNIPSDYRVSSDNNINFDIYVDTTSTVQLFNRSTNQCTFESPSVKEVLKNA